MIIKWIGDDQYTSYGAMRHGCVYDVELLGIPAGVIENWVNSGWAVVYAQEISDETAAPKRRGGRR